MTPKPRKTGLIDGARCTVVGGTHRGQTGIVRDLKVSRTGHLTLTVSQSNGKRFKALAKNVRVSARD